MSGCEKVAFTGKLSVSVVGKQSCGGSSKDKPVAIAHECELLSVVIQSDESPQSCDKWLTSIMNVDGEGSSSNNSTPKHKIHGIPQMLRQMERNKKFYDPEVVSIGPYHHGKRELESMEKFKIQLTREFVKSIEGFSINALYKKVEEVAGEARKCYAEGSTEAFDDITFTRMMFLDGCFVLQFIHCMNENRDEMKMKSHDKAFVKRDLFLLENQLPFKVLQALMKFKGEEGMEMITKFIEGTRARPPADSLLERVENFIARHLTGPRSEQTRSGESQGGSQQSTGSGKSQDVPVHLLELLRRQLIVPEAVQTGNENQRSDSWYSYRSAQDLKSAGIRFRPNKRSPLFTEARYENLWIRAILRLPPMTIDDSTESLLLNLVAYEMCPDGPNDSGVTSYLWFIDTLIDHAEDVKELRRSGILLNFLSSDQHVADLFNDLTSNLVPNPHAYDKLKEQIEKHYKSKVSLWVTEWFHAHFSSPWTVLTFGGAILAIALSITQTYFAIHPSKS